MGHVAQVFCLFDFGERSQEPVLIGCSLSIARETFILHKPYLATQIVSKPRA